jgi:hypothetical protein
MNGSANKRVAPKASGATAYAWDRVAPRLALTHLSTMSQYTPARSPVSSGERYPPFMVNTALFWTDKFDSFPTNSVHLYPPFYAHKPHPAVVETHVMAIEAPLSVRAGEQVRRDDAREAASQYLAERAVWRRESRVEEAKASAAARPTVAERAPEQEHRPRAKPANGSGRKVDILA